MKIEANQLYHIYNQGNNHEIVFCDAQDYIEFLRRCRLVISPNCEIVSYCLMPNHFHFLINSTEQSSVSVSLGTVQSTLLANGFRLLCSGYANYFNKKYNRSGSLFRQKTKAKNLEDSLGNDYPFICFHYIHQNPMIAGLCKKMEDWEFSSFRDYLKIRRGTLVNQSIAFNLIGISQTAFYEESYLVISENKINELYIV
jgi:REP element-mobilizing transposase RayT